MSTSTQQATAPASAVLPLKQILICGALIVTLSMGIRHGFGLWLSPVSAAHEWDRQVFSFALALQNLSWGFFGIFAGMIADRFGAYKVLIAGAIAYCLGLLGMAFTQTPLGFSLTTGVLLGLAQAGTTYSIVYGVLGRNISMERRSWAMGVTAAAGSFGQFFMLPVENFLIDWLNWQNALVFLAMASLIIIILARGLREPEVAQRAQSHDQSIFQAIKEAFGYRSFCLLVAGYFTCGFQVVFIGVHLPGYIKDYGMQADVASTALALIGLFNVVGTYVIGVLGQTYQKRFLLMGIYAVRAVVIALFIFSPISVWSVYLFSIVMGMLWLSTVPPTNSIVVQIFGVRHFSMLSGFVFFSHQIGAFLGVWLGGVLYDRYGNYDMIWYVAIGLSIITTLIHIPMRETPIERKTTVLA